MAERYDFYVHDNRKVTFNLTEPIMREDSGVTDFVFHIPKILNELDVSDWQWWLVFVNAKKEKYSIALTLSDDPESPLEKNVATYTVDYAMSIKAGSVQFALEAINTGTGGAIDNEWHTLTYETKVKETLQGNQAEYAETESDIISALLEEVRTKMNQVIGGATPTPVASVSAMTDPSKLYLLTTDGEWYYHNGTQFVSGGVYGAGIVDSVPTQGSTNAVSSGGVYDALEGVSKVKNTDAKNGIFDISDKQGNVIMRLEDGMIKTYKSTVGYHVVTVKPSGGDFTSLRAAVESITDADARLNPYIIEVYEGTYNVLADYTDAEIRTSGFSGLIIGDGINIRGIGNRDNIVIHGELSATDYDSTLRNEVSTLNLVNEMWIENITVTATNIRYCVHDDLPPTRPYYTRHVKNCKFRIVNATSGSQQKAWGEGSRQGKTTILEDCDFGTCMLWHSDNTGSATRAGKLIVKNCTAMMALINCKNHSVLHQVYLYNNNFALISHSFTDGSTSNKMMQVTGTGKGAMTNAPSDWNYVNGDIERFRTNGTLTLANGQLVIPSTTPYWVSGTLTKATNPKVAYGVVVGQDNDFFYVQKDGYINVDRFGFSGLVVGDKITVKSDGTLEVNGTGETFGVVCCVTNDYGTYMRRVA